MLQKRLVYKFKPAAPSKQHIHTTVECYRSKATNINGSFGLAWSGPMNAMELRAWLEAECHWCVRTCLSEVLKQYTDRNTTAARSRAHILNTLLGLRGSGCGYNIPKVVIGTHLNWLPSACTHDKTVIKLMIIWVSHDTF